MNTNIIYSLKIRIENDSYSYHETLELNEIAYKALLKDLESKKFISFINLEQNPITIRVKDIWKIEAIIKISEPVKVYSITEEED